VAATFQIRHLGLPGAGAHISHLGLLAATSDVFRHLDLLAVLFRSAIFLYRGTASLIRLGLLGSTTLPPSWFTGFVYQIRHLGLPEATTGVRHFVLLDATT
jgi:hypothetical protein